MSGLKSQLIFDKMAPLLKDHGADLVKKVGAVFHFEVRKAAGDAPTTFTLDLKNGSGAFANGAEGKADATFIVLDDDLVAISAGTLNPQVAFM
jgi:3-hydroxyacyl-CoA dehydrogenase/3a,7a,12a-trihydroxy-5b-cholest-24-enoyl-CoA hydratase